MTPSPAVATKPPPGEKPAVVLTVRLKPPKHAPTHEDAHAGGPAICDGIRELYGTGEFADIALVCADTTFLAHRIVLAAQSDVFKQGFSMAPVTPSTGVAPPRQEIRLADIANPEAVKFMLDYVYGIGGEVWDDYNPQTQEINKDVLRLAQNFALPALKARAVHWLAKDLTTGNVVERLNICKDFGLDELEERILKQLTTNRKALAEVANSPQIMTYPRLMQAMLQCAAGPRPSEEPEERENQPPPAQNTAGPPAKKRKNS